MRELTLPDLRNKVSICIKDLMHYNDLGFILNNLEPSILLPMPVKTNNSTYEEYSTNKEIALAAFEQCKDNYILLSEELALRKNTFEKIRKKYSNFCIDIKSSLTPEEYKNYIDLLKEVKETLNYIISGGFTDKINLDELLLQRKDRLSNLIDSELTSRLGNIEDTFVLNELDKIDITLLDSHTQQNIQRIKEIVNARIQNFTEYSKLYSAKKIQFRGRNFFKKEREIGD